MKKVMFLFLALFCYNSNAQDLLPVDEAGVLTYSDIVDVKGTKDELFSKARTWAVKTWKNYQTVVQLEDKESGKIVIKGTQYLNVSVGEFRYSYTLNIDVKDNKYRCVIDNILPESKIVSSWMSKSADMMNRSVENSNKELENTDMKKKDRDIAEKINIEHKYRNNKINSTMKGLLSDLRKSMETNDDW